MGRVYTVEFENVAVSAAQDLFEITPGDDKPVALHALYLGQTSDVGDTEEEVLRVKIIRGHATSGSGGTVLTPAPLDAGDVAAGFTAEANNTTPASTGTPLDLYVVTFNIRVGLQMIFTPEMRPRCGAAETLIVVNLPAAPADALTMSGTLVVEEIM